MKKLTCLYLLALVAAFAVIGYVNSDAVFYKRLIAKNSLAKPAGVFKWVTTHYGNKPQLATLQSNLSPRYLIENHKQLWCDEGAIVMATLDHELGYKTKLRDLYGNDNISHHTILAVFENGRWINYDFTSKLRNQPPAVSTRALNYKLKYPNDKPYPRLYNAVVNNNYFLKKIAFALRGIQETPKQQPAESFSFSDGSKKAVK